MIKEKNHKVLYLTCLENTYNNDIHQCQVLGLKEKGVDYSFLFISPWFILGKSGLTINKNKFRQEGVNEVKIPIFSANLVMHLFLIPYYILITCPILFYFAHKENIHVVHCRNLISTLLAVFCKVVLFQRFKVVCDPRSVYVEEGVIIGRFKYKGFNYRGWKKLEKWICKKSDVCCGLSYNFAKYLEHSNEHSIYIPAVVKPTFVYDEIKRKELRVRFGLTNNHHVCLYVGSIGFWHSVDLLLKTLDAYKESLQKGEEMKVVFLSGNKSACDTINSHFVSGEVLKCGRVSPDEVLEYILLSDYGIVPGSDEKGYCYDLLYNTMLSSKAEEFLSAGLPIITNERIVSLSKLLKDNNAGIIFNHKGSIIDYFDGNRKRISQVFHEMFSADKVVLLYKSIYSSLTK